MAKHHKDGASENSKTPRQRITGSALALQYCKTRAQINRKMGNSTPCKIVSPGKFYLETLHTWLRRRGYLPCKFWF